MEHISFGSIESFHNKVKQAGKSYTPEMIYHVKPKLHGTNAGIVITKDSVYAQSRRNVITPELDNVGFAEFVHSLNIDLKSNIIADSTCVIYGEWAGAGIQRHDAVCLIPNKTFFVICIRYIYGDGSETVIHEPEIIEEIISNMNVKGGNIKVIPNMAKLSINLQDVGSLEAAETTINAYVDQFETVDPYIQDMYGITAPGEGVVVSPSVNDWESYHKWSFKAKTSNHRVNKAKKAASAVVQISPDVADFVDRFATESRFHQAMTELGITSDMKNMGAFLKWVNVDIIKESKDELEESEIEWKQCVKHVNAKARNWFSSPSNTF